MLYIVWALLNVLVCCLFFWLAYKALRMVRDKFGWAASLFFIVGLLSFMNAPEEKENENSLSLQEPHLILNKPDQVNQSTVLKKYPLFAVHLSVLCDVLPDGKSVKPVSVLAGQYGFVMAHKWKLNSATVNYTAANHQLKYTVNGSIRWNLLGIPFYTQSKTFEGHMAVQ